jgi:hypothetical protein
MQVGENGGIKTDTIDYLKSPIYERDRFTIPTNIGGEPQFGADLFSSNLTTGRREKESTYFLRQQYDFGKKDSIVTDSTVISLFYPRIRFEHNFRTTTHDFLFQDLPINDRSHNTPDSLYYKSRYNFILPANDSVYIHDHWREITNDFSIYQFPDIKNLQQFIKVGAEIQLIRGTLKNGTESLYNVIGHGEYRNRTKNKIWDIVASGKLYLTGTNFGDYHGYISLQRLLSERLGHLQVGFENTNRSPSYIFNSQSSFL